jgi:hypothetical protein
LLVVALIVGAPVGHMAAAWLVGFANTYHMPITYSSVAIAVVMMIVLVLATISTQITKVLRSNTVSGLKTE